MNSVEATPINALIIGGAGIQGRRHLEARNRLGGAKTTIFDTDVEKARDVAEELGAKAVTTPRTLGGALRKADIVHVCTPDHLHTEYALAGLEADSHVFVEKPMTTNLSDALQIQKEAHRKGREVAVGTGYRLTPTFAEIKRLVGEGNIGDILSLETTYLHDMKGPIKATPWRANQDFLYGGGIHAIDLARWIMGEEIGQVQASIGKKRLDKKVYASPEDYAIALRSRSGVIARIWLNALAKTPTHGTDLRVFGTKGTYTSHNKWDKYEYFAEGEYDGQQVIIPLQNNGIFTVDLQIQILDQWLRGERPNFSPIPGVDEGVAVMKVVDAVARSIKSGIVETVAP